jgi:hypothetical protein
MSDDEKRYTQADLDEKIRARVAEANASHDRKMTTASEKITLLTGQITDLRAEVDTLKPLGTIAADFEKYKAEIENDRIFTAIGIADDDAGKALRTKVAKWHAIETEDAPEGERPDLKTWAESVRTAPPAHLAGLFPAASQQQSQTTTTTTQRPNVPDVRTNARAPEVVRPATLAQLQVKQAELHEQARKLPLAERPPVLKQAREVEAQMRTLSA